MLVRPVMLAIGGGSGSGKTTLAKWLSTNLKDITVQIISEDNYNHDHAGKKGFSLEGFNFDDVARKDHELLLSHLHALRSGNKIDQPLYSFKKHRRTKEKITIHASGVIIVEGIHVLYHDDIRKLMDLSVYIDVPDDVRLARRILRDFKERKRKPNEVITQYLATVKPMHYRYTYPGRFQADYVLFDEAQKVSNVELEHFGFPILRHLQKILNQAA